MTQKMTILGHLKDVGPITPLESIRLYGCYRLSGRIHDLRQMGYQIHTTTIVVKKKNGETAYVAQYSLEEGV